MVPGEVPSTAAVVEGIVQMSAEELRELERCLPERPALESAEG